MAQITFDDKIALKQNNLPRKNQITADDINELKSVINANETSGNNTNGIGFWTLTNASAVAPPNTGQINFDDSSIGASTIFRIHKNDGDNRFSFLTIDTFDTGDFIVLFDKSDAEKYIIVTLGAKTNETNYFQFDGSSATAVGTITTGIEFFAFPIKNRAGVTWKGNWIPETLYKSNDIVKDGEWTMIATESTDTRPSPQKFLSSAFYLPESPSWSNNSVAKTIETGIRIQNPDQIHVVNGVRVWIPDTADTMKYQIIIRNKITDAIIFCQRASGSDFGTVGWHTVNCGSIFITSSDDVMVILQTIDESNENFNYLDFVYSGKSTVSNDPSNGYVEINDDFTLLRISNTDRNAVDVTTENAQVLIGSAIKVSQQANPINNFSARITGVINNGTWYEFNMTLESIGSGGLPTIGQNVEIEQAYPIPSATDYVILSNQYSSTDFVSGYFQTSNDGEHYDQNGYGVDLLVQKYTTNGKWTPMSFSPIFELGNAVRMVGDVSNGGGGSTNSTIGISFSASESVNNYLCAPFTLDITCTLPASPTDGTKWNIKNVSLNNKTVNIVVSGGANIDDQTSVTLENKGDNLTVLYDANSNQYWVL